MKQILSLPTEQQTEWHDMEIGMFIHWAPNVYHEAQCDLLLTPLSEINPVNLNTDEWVQVAKDLGAKYIIMVAKHVGGFCLWQTDTSDYGIKNIPWRNGKGDILKDLSESCRNQGIKLGVYLSPQDEYKGIGIGGKAKDPSKQELYDEIFRQQLVEVLTRYGDISEVWFDGSTDCEMGDILEKYAPKAMVFNSKNATIRWCGTETGFTKYPVWNSVSKEAALSGVATNVDGTPDGDVWLPMECDTTIREDWFWSTTNQTTLKSLDLLMRIYYNSVGNGGVLLLNANPDRTGQIPQEDAIRVKEYGDSIRKIYKGKVFNTSGSGPVLEMDIGALTKIDHIITMEDISKGERIRKYIVEGFDGERWISLSSGTAIGHKRIDRIIDTIVSKVRFTALRYADTPYIKDFSVYFSGLPFYVDNSLDPESEYIRIFQWGEEEFWFREPGDMSVSLDIDLSNILTEVEDVGQYEIKIMDKIGLVKLMEYQLEFGGQVKTNYIRKQNEGSILMYIPAVDTKIRLKLNLEVLDTNT